MEAGGSVDHKPSPLAGRMVHEGRPEGGNWIGTLEPGGEGPGG